MRYTRHQLPAAHQQDGAALFMALIFLLILTILGVFGMNLSRLENLMSGNAQFQTTALNNAEYVLARGEKDIEDIAKSGNVPVKLSAWSNTTDQYYTAGTTPGGKPKDLVWPFKSEKVSLPDVDGDGTADDGTGEYVIENAGTDLTHGEDSTSACTLFGECPPGAIVQVFLVTAQSESSRGAKRIVQSVVVTDPLPDTILP